MPLWRRQPSAGRELELARQTLAASAPAVLGAVSGDQLCSQLGCYRNDAVRCAYVDRRERACPWTACPGHQAIQGGRAYCPHHAATLTAVGIDAPLAARPDIDNAAPAHVSWMFRDLHDAVAGVMEGLVHYGEGERVAVDSLARIVRTAEGRRWSQGWRLIANTGTIFTVAVEVREEQPENIIVRVGNRILFDAIPPWLVPGASDDTAVRLAYLAQVIEGITTMGQQERRTERERLRLRA